MDHLTEHEDIIHGDEVAADPSKAQVLHRTSRIRTVPERYEFLINKQRDVLFIENDEPTTYKARLIAKGYLQRQGIDYDETFSSIAMLSTLNHCCSL